MNKLTIVLAVMLAVMPAALLAKTIESCEAIKTDSLDPLIELLMIESYHTNTPEDLVYYFGVSATTVEFVDGNPVDTSNISGLLQTYGNKYNLYYSDSDIVNVQDNLYNVTLDGADSTMYVGPPVNMHEMLFHFNLFDTALHQHQIDTITLTEQSCYREIKFFFNHESPFIDWSVTYDPAQYEIISITYRLKNEVVSPGTLSYTPSDYISVTVECVWLDSSSYHEEYFASYQYVSRQNGILIPTPAYAHYRLINSFDE